MASLWERFAIPRGKAQESCANGLLTMIFFADNLLIAAHIHVLHSGLKFADFKGSAVKEVFVRFVKDGSGATAVELGLIAAGISLSITIIFISLVINR